MTIEYQCPVCRETTRLPDQEEGRLSACARCGLKFIAPAPSSPAEPEVPPSADPFGLDQPAAQSADNPFQPLSVTDLIATDDAASSMGAGLDGRDPRRSSKKFEHVEDEDDDEDEDEADEHDSGSSLFGVPLEGRRRGLFGSEELEEEAEDPDYDEDAEAAALFDSGNMPRPTRANPFPQPFAELDNVTPFHRPGFQQGNPFSDPVPEAAPDEQGEEARGTTRRLKRPTFDAAPAKPPANPADAYKVRPDDNPFARPPAPAREPAADQRPAPAAPQPSNPFAANPDAGLRAAEPQPSRQPKRQPPADNPFAANPDAELRAAAPQPSRQPKRPPPADNPFAANPDADMAARAPSGRPAAGRPAAGRASEARPAAQRRTGDSAGDADRFTLSVVDGAPAETYRFTQGGSYVVGRDHGTDMKILSKSVSRRHARIETTGPEPVLIDLGSANGTQVNGTKVSRLVLNHGDLIKMGEVIMRFQAH